MKTVMLYALLTCGVILTLSYARGDDEADWQEAGMFVKQLSDLWKQDDYSQIDQVIANKLVVKPAWIPAVLAKAFYLSRINCDPQEALETLATIDIQVGALDSVKYKKFLLLLEAYKNELRHQVETGFGAGFSNEEKQAYRQLSHKLYHYFPGVEVIAVYYNWKAAGGGN